MSKDVEKQCEDKCPKCGSQDIKERNGELAGDLFIWSCSCSKCGCYYHEEHKLVYHITTYVEE